MNHLRHPAQFFHCFECTAHEEDASLVVVLGRTFGFEILSYGAVEIVLIEYKVHLHARGLQCSDFND